MTVRDTKPKRTEKLTHNGPKIMEKESDDQEEQLPWLEDFVAQPIPQVRRFNKDDILMATMDVTGAGKSTFVSLLTDERVEIGHDLQSSKHGRPALEYSPDNRLFWAAEKGQEAVV